MLSCSVLAIPLRLLWRVRIDHWQKLNVGVCLCLGIVDILIAMMRFAGLRLLGIVSIDYTWEAFWFYLEPYVAVIVISVTAFRSAIVSNIKRSREREVRPNWRSCDMHWTRNQKLSDRGDYNALPSVPTATLAGIRTFIREHSRPEVRRSYMKGSRVANEKTVYGRLPAMSDQQIKVSRVVDMSARSVDVSCPNQREWSKLNGARQFLIVKGFYTADESC